MSEMAAFYLLSTIIQSLAALVAITKIVDDYRQRKMDSLHTDLYRLADTYWRRANRTVGAVTQPDVSMHTTPETVPEWLEKELPAIEEQRHADLSTAIRARLQELRRMRASVLSVSRRDLMLWGAGGTILLSVPLIYFVPNLPAVVLSIWLGLVGVLFLATCGGFIWALHGATTPSVEPVAASEKAKADAQKR